MRRLPTRKEILEEATARSMKRAIREGLPAITPEEAELRESGDIHEARRNLMSNEWAGEQRKYLEDMASEMRLAIIPRKGLITLRKETGYEWTNGWTRHKKRTTKPKPKPKKVPCPYCDDIITLSKAGLIPGSHMIQHKRVKGKWVSTAPKPKPVARAKKPKKRKKRHVERAGKIPRSKKIRQRINDGQKVFSFPDHIWKVRKPKKRRR